MPPMPNPNAPPCPKCERHMASNGATWRCTTCGYTEYKADGPEIRRGKPLKGRHAKSAPVYVPPAPRKPGKTITIKGDTIEITPDGYLVLNGGSMLPASPVEVLLWEYIHAAG